MQGQIEKLLQALQSKVNTSIPSNTDNNPKWEGEEHAKVRQTIVVVDDEDDAPIPNVEKG
ncbi:hypothetical protein PVK06_024417 [Gossypium arboreum]|uniref:Uncharacterized protein n=1 Tax=Gossypium arboreum TaxID=29729 RepID=A0ABR0PE41_GOSAR|nr:hypothetical protein PVK06_024417 [Gossypium arboreum]